MAEEKGEPAQNNPQELTPSGLTRQPEAQISSKKTKKGISKRQVLGRLMAAAGIISTMGLGGDTHQKSPGETIRDEYATTAQYLETFQSMEKLSTKELIRKAEETYHIQISSPGQRTITLVDGREIKPNEWNKSEIMDLMKTLDLLPLHFYLPNPGRAPVDFIMSDIDPRDLNKGGISAGARCFCGPNNKITAIVFTRVEFNYDVHSASRTITHELTHRVSGPEDDQFVRDLLGIPDDTKLAASLEKGSRAVEYFLFTTEKTDKDRYDFLLTGIMLRYGATNPDEFLSVASEFYIDGKENFIKIYDIFIGKEKAQGLYDHMRDNIFRGKEYQGVGRVKLTQ